MTASQGDVVEHISHLRDLGLQIELEAELFERKALGRAFAGRAEDTIPSPPPSAPSADDSGAFPPASSKGELPVVKGDAEYRVSEAMNALCGAVVTIEKLAVALARLIDSER